jgi:hypothetical protein
MTTNTNNENTALDSALSEYFTKAGEKLGLQFSPTASAVSTQTTFEVKDTRNEKLVGIVRLDPYAGHARSFAANSAQDHSVSIVSVGLNLEKPEDGQTPTLDDKNLQALYKMSQHTLSILAAKKEKAATPANVPAFKLNA